MTGAAVGVPGSDPLDPAAAEPESGGTTRRRSGPRYQRNFVSAAAVDLRSTRGRLALRDWVVRRLRKGNGRGPAVCGCGLPARDVDEIEWWISPDGRARPVGTLRCKSAVLCPVCPPWQARKLQARLQVVVDAAAAGGGSVGMLTLTLRHHRGHELRCLRGVAIDAIRRVFGGRAWLRVKREGGLLGQVKVVEAPWGAAHGWHLHLHLLLVFDHRDEARARSVAAQIEARWIAQVAAQGFEALPIGQKFKPCYDAAGAAGYCAKLAAELAHGWAKQVDGQDPNDLVGIFTIAHRAMAGDQQADRLFLEYAEAMSGLQQGRVSEPLRVALRLNDHQSPVEAVAEDREGEIVGCQSREEYMALYAGRKLPDLTALIERECPPDIGIWGWPEVIEWTKTTLGLTPQPPPPAWRVSAERVAREVRARRAVSAGISTAEIVERTLDAYRSRSGPSLRFELPDLNAVLAELASS